MKLRIACKIEKRIEQERWSETTLARVNRRMRKTATQKEADAFWRELCSPRNVLLWHAQRFFERIEEMASLYEVKE